MAVINHREVLPRTFAHKFGDAPTGTRKFIATLTEPVAHQTVLDAIGIFFGATHPEYTYLRCTNADLNETDRQHVEVTYQYSLLQPDQNDPNPLLRPDVWNFSVGGASVPALIYYPDNSNDAAPLVNAAYDIFENLTTEEAEIRATVSGNRAQFPLELAAFVTNTVNDAPYLGGNEYTWKCAGISGTQQIEVVNNIEVRYYQITSELVYRASGWRLLLPDVGFNFLAEFDDNGQQRVRQERCYRVMKDGDEETKVPSANALPLAENGKMLAEGEEPRILVRRVHRATNFDQYFGSPGF